MTPFAIETENLRKTYGEFEALSSLSLQVRAGEVFGFLGPNGAGKTTTLRVLMGILVPTSGRATILGLDCLAERVELKRQVGYLPDAPIFYDYLKGWELLRFVGQMHGMVGRELDERMSRLLDDMQLADAADEYVANYSLGMKKKMGLALALIHDPSVLILDEPTTGLDPMATRQLRAVIRGWAERGRTVLLSTHLLDMAEKLCDRVGIIHQGRLVTVGAPAELRASAIGNRDAQSSLEDVFIALTNGEHADSANVEASRISEQPHD